MTDDDALLLRRYAASGDDAAFTELVRRRFDLVYGVALRRLEGDHDGAAEVAQSVFLALAKKAASVASHPAILGWLHTSAGFAAGKRRRAAARRSQREREAAALNAIASEPDPAPDGAFLQACLDAQLDLLKPREREAVLERFYGGKGYGEVGESMGLSPNAARMRVERSLERLRAGLARKGITSTAAAVAAALEASAASAAPPQLSGAIASQVLGQVGAASLAGSGATLLVMTKVTTTLAAAGAAALIGAGLYYAQRTASLAQDAARLSRSNAAQAQRAAAVLPGSSALLPGPAAPAPAAAVRASDPTDSATPFVQQEMAENPKFRAALAQLLDANFRRRDGALFRQLNLTNDQIQRWSAVQLQRASDWHDISEAIRRAGSDVAAAAPMEAQAMAKYDTALGDIIGADHVAEADRYERLYPARDWVSRLTAETAAAGSPLSSQQAATLFQAIASQNVPPAPGLLTMNLKAVDWDKVAAEAQGCLTADQVTHLNAFRAAQTAQALHDAYDSAR